MHEIGNASTTSVTREFKKSGLTQAELARRLGKAPEVVFSLSQSAGQLGIGHAKRCPICNFRGGADVQSGLSASRKSDERMIRTSTDATKLFHPYGSARRWLEWMHISSSSLAPVTTAWRRRSVAIATDYGTKQTRILRKVFEGVVG